MDVWRFECSSGFTKFHFVDEIDKEWFENIVELYFNETKSAKEVWKEFTMIRGEPKKSPDFFEIDDSGVIAISLKAKKIIEKEFIFNVELLPFETDAGKFFAINIIDYLDCFDKRESECTISQFGQIIEYDLIDFYPDKIGESIIFKIPELPYVIFVVGELLEYCENFLEGLEFDSDVNLEWYEE